MNRGAGPPAALLRLGLRRARRAAQAVAEALGTSRAGKPAPVSNVGIDEMREEAASSRTPGLRAYGSEPFSGGR
jgi:hypothetical protein